MGRKGILFKDWCNKKGYNLEEFYVGDRSIEKLDCLLSSDEKNKLTFRCEKCGEIYSTAPQTIKDNEKNDNKRFICNTCHRAVKIISRKNLDQTQNDTIITVQDWLDQNTNIKFIGEITDKGINRKVSPSSISATCSRKIRVLCTTHNYIKDGKVQNICKNKLNCCTAKFLFQDWCLLFYRYRFYAYYNGWIERKTKIYTGKQAYIYYRDDKHVSDRKQLASLLINYSNKKFFKCHCNEYFEVPVNEVCRGKAWCDKEECNKCNEEAYKFNKELLETEKVIDTFIKTYCEDNLSIIHNYKAKKILYSQICSETNIRTYTLEKTINKIVETDKELQKIILNILNTTSNRHKKYDSTREKSVEERRDRLIYLIKMITSAEENNDPEIKKMRLWYNDNYKTTMGESDLCLIIPEQEINSRERNKANISKSYDYLIYLNGTTINGLEKGILFGRPINWKNRNETIEMVPEISLNEDEITISEIKPKWLSPVFNGVAKKSFVNQTFANFIFLDEWLELEENSFEGCKVDGFLTIKRHQFSSLRNLGIITDLSNKIKIDFISDISSDKINGKLSINAIKTVEIGFVQYKDIFKLGEYLRVYENRLTLYRPNQSGIFEEYEYMNGFEYGKFYNDEDEMAISILLSQYNIVKISEVTEALIDIYNEMNT